MQPTPPQPPMYYPPPPRQSSSSTVIIILVCVFGGLAVIGILAAVAIPSFMNTMKKSKRSEAELNLRSIERGIKAYYVERSTLPQPSSGLTPAFPCCDAGRPDRKCEPEVESWMEEPWSSIGFEVYDPGYFQYSYEVSPGGDSFTARAVGDLDCDANMVTYELVGRVGADGYIQMTLVKPANAD